MTKEITNSDDIIYSRDVIARIEELESERDALVDARNEAEDAYASALMAKAEAVEERDKAGSEDDAAIDALDEACAAVDEAEVKRDLALDELAQWNEDFGDEFKALSDFIDQGDDKWRYGTTLVRDSYFKDFAMCEAENIGAIDHVNRWPATCIDWEQAARKLQMDYTSVDFDGVTYWVRS